jgi:hypothetical protein
MTLTGTASNFLTGCGTTETKPVIINPNAPQSFSSDLYVERDGKSYKIKSDIVIVNPRAIRLDMRTTLDLPLASIVLTDQKIDYALYRDKKFYTGRPGPHALDPVFPLAVDVKTLNEILQQKKITGAKCEVDDLGPLSCSGQAGSTTFNVSWSKRQTSGPLAGRASKIVLDLPQRHVSLRFYLNDWQHDVPNAEHLLSLQTPSGFTTLSTP